MQPEEDQVSAAEDMSDAPISEFEASPTESANKSGEHAASFGETMNVLKLSPTEVSLLRKSFDMLLLALGNDREAVGDAIYGLKIHALVAIKDNFTTPRAVVSLRFFNCFRLLLEKAEDPDELKIYVETLAFKHLQNDVTELRVDKVIDAFNELLTNNVPDLPPGTWAAWRTLLSHTGSCYRFVGETYGERLRIIKETGQWSSERQRMRRKMNESKTKKRRRRRMARLKMKSFRGRMGPKLSASEGCVPSAMR